MFKLLTKYNQSNYLIISLICLNLFLLAFTFEDVFRINSIYKYIFSITAFILIIIVFFKSKNNKNLSDFDRVMVYIMLLNILFRLLYMPFESRINYAHLSFLQVFFGVRFYALPYVIILFLLMKEFEFTFIKLLMGLQYKLLFFAIFFELLFIAFFTDNEFFGWYSQIQVIWTFELSFPLIFLICHLSEKKWINLLSIIYLILFLYITANYGRRGLTIDHVLFIAAGVIIKSSSKYYKSKFLPYLVLIILILAAITPFILDGIGNLYIFERGLDQESLNDSRQNVFDDFFEDFARNSSWYLGRGMDGSFTRKDTVFDSGTADYIENGFLQIILKMGLLFLIPMIYLFFKGFYLSYFKSNNDFSRSIALLLVIYILGMIPFNVPDYSSKFLIIWIFLSMSFSKKIRQFSNLDIKNIINS
jgi:O-antigen ligase